jgi:hypothetical protein
VMPRAPSPWRVVLLAAGLAELTYFVLVGRPSTTPGQIQAYLSGTLITMAGLIVAGPWLTMLGSRLMARRATRPETLIAGRRLADDPRAGFRAISGLVLALFVTSVAVGVITTIRAYNGGPRDSAADRATLVQGFFGQSDGVAVAQPTTLLDKLRSIPGVRAVTVVHADRADIDVALGPPVAYVLCSELAQTPVLGTCPPGATTAAFSAEFGGPDENEPATPWTAASLTPDAVLRLPVHEIAVATNGSTTAIEQARTVLDSAYPTFEAAATLAEASANNPTTQRTTQYEQLASVVILTSLPIAGCTLAVSVVGGLNDRRRPFSLLRLTGAPLSMLRRVVAWESAVPLLLLTFVSTVTGFVVAYLFLRSQLDESLQAPGVAYFLVVVAGLLASLAIIASTLPVLSRITGPESARND